MKYNCPQCTKSLQWKLLRSKPLPGERKFLPSRAVQVCPFCSVGLSNNTHWSETLLMVLFILPLMGVFKGSKGPDAKIILWITCVWLAVSIAAGIFFHVRYLRHWQRYKRHEPDRS